MAVVCLITLGRSSTENTAFKYCTATSARAESRDLETIIAFTFLGYQSSQVTFK